MISGAMKNAIAGMRAIFTLSVCLGKVLRGRISRAASRPLRARAFCFCWMLFDALSGDFLHGQDIVTRFSGSPRNPGFSDGAGSAALFHDPTGIALDEVGNLYVADRRNHVVRRISPEGVVATFAGDPGHPGNADGPGTTARFQEPSDLVIDRRGNLFVADSGNHLIRRISPGGDVVTVAGRAGVAGGADGMSTDARFNGPLGIAIDLSGDLIVADTGNHTVRRIRPSGQVSTIAGQALLWGIADGVGAGARFNGPLGVAVGVSGAIFVSDSNNHTLRRISLAGIVTTLAGLPGRDGFSDGVGAEARFCHPADLVVDRNGDLYVADSLNHLIRKVTMDGEVVTIAGRAREVGQTDGSIDSARFFNPYGLAADGSGNLYLSDAYNQTIRLMIARFRTQINSSPRGELVEITFDSLAGRRYQVQFSENADLSQWENLGLPIVADGISTRVSDAGAADSQRRFYRVLLAPP